MKFLRFKSEIKNKENDKDKEQHEIARSKLDKTTKGKLRHKNKEDLAISCSKLDKTEKDKLTPKTKSNEIARSYKTTKDKIRGQDKEQRATTRNSYQNNKSKYFQDVRHLTLYFPIFPFDHSENIRKPLVF